MEQVTVWYLTDNDHGTKVIDTIKGMGINLNNISGYDLSHANIVESDINIFIFDIQKSKPDLVIKKISEEQRLHSPVKFLILSKKQIKDLQKKSYNIFHLELLSRPVYKREFLLLLEKTIIVERYREIMKFVSKEAEARIETYEGLMDINRKRVFETENEKKAFEKILLYEKNLMKEQAILNNAIKRFTMLRQTEMFDLNKRIRAEEMLAELRRKELMDANNIINAQGNIIDYSAKELDQAKRIIGASESVAELSRSEAIDMKDELARQKEMNRSLSEEIDILIEENERLKGQLKKI